ncbi:MAG: serine O-acetyltransferase [Actinomycetota bacterium]
MARRPPTPGEQLLAGVRARHPRFTTAVAADARLTLAMQGKGTAPSGRGALALVALRLAWSSDAFLATACYRAKARLQALRVPVLPRLLHRLAMMLAQVCIGDPVVVAPGCYLAHGQVVVDGFVEIGPGVVLFPWVTIGLRAGDFRGPTIGAGAHIGTGAKVIGPVTVGERARVGANAVVTGDVAPGTTVVGAPARPVGSA